VIICFCASLEFWEANYFDLGQVGGWGSGGAGIKQFDAKSWSVQGMDWIIDKNTRRFS
jgi:hypothetical protein